MSDFEYQEMCLTSEAENNPFSGEEGRDCWIQVSRNVFHSAKKEKKNQTGLCLKQLLVFLLMMSKLTGCSTKIKGLLTSSHTKKKSTKEQWTD